MPSGLVWIDAPDDVVNETEQKSPSCGDQQLPIQPDDAASVQAVQEMPSFEYIPALLAFR
jgi:hypothetical protein